MMKKKVIIKQLDDEGITGYENLDWKDLQIFYKDKMEELKNSNMELSKPTEESVNERVERKPEIIKTQLELTRERLFPKIVKLMNDLNGRTRASQNELRLMFDLYNAFYLRNDSPSCGSCVGRVYSTFQKICKGRY